MQNNTCETWESLYGWRLRGQIWMKHSSVLMLHMTMSQVCWHANLPSMYLLCKLLYNGRLCIKNKETLPLTRRDLRSSLEIIRGPAKCSRTWNNSSKHKKRCGCASPAERLGLSKELLHLLLHELDVEGYGVWMHKVLELPMELLRYARKQDQHHLSRHICVWWCNTCVFDLRLQRGLASVQK
jgi:hypothetical protein